MNLFPSSLIKIIKIVINSTKSVVCPFSEIWAGAFQVSSKWRMCKLGEDRSVGGWGSQGPRCSHLLVHFSYGGVSVLQDFAKLFSHVSTLGGGGCAPSFCHLKVHLSFPPAWGQCQTFVAFWQPSFDLNCKANIVHHGTKDSWKGPSPRIQEITPLTFWSLLEKWFCLRAAAQLKRKG